MAVNKHSVSIDGEIVGTRNSKTRTYGFAVVAKVNDYGDLRWNADQYLDIPYAVLSWSSRRDLAETAAAKPRTYKFWDRNNNLLGLDYEWVRVIPVDQS